MLANIKYPFKFWVTSILIISPAVEIITEYIFKPEYFYLTATGVLQTYLAGAFGLLLSLPALVVFYFVFKWLVDKELNAVLIKLILFAVYFSTLFLTSYIASGEWLWGFIIDFSIGGIIGSLIFKVYGTKIEIMEN
jgi:hypothetical protein